MLKTVKLLVPPLLVPVFALAVSFGTETLLNHRLKAPILRVHPEATPGELEMVNIRSLCASHVPGLGAICRIYGNLRVIRFAALAVLAAGLLCALAFRRTGLTNAAAHEKIRPWLTLAIGAFAITHSALAALTLYYGSLAYWGLVSTPFLAATILPALFLTGFMTRVLSKAM